MQNHEGFGVISNHFTSFVPFFCSTGHICTFCCRYYFFVTVLLHVLGQSNVYLSYAFFWPVVLVLHTYSITLSVSMKNETAVKIHSAKHAKLLFCFSFFLRKEREKKNKEKKSLSHLMCILPKFVPV